MELSTPIASVLFPVCNEEVRWLTLAMESIHLQTFRDFKWIIVLDGSARPDLEEVIMDFKDKDARIYFFKKMERSGLALTLNEAAQHAHGRYLIRMDADDIALLHRVEHQVRYVEEYPHIAFAGSQVVKTDEDGNPIGVSHNPISEELIRRMVPYVNISTHPSMIMRREVFNRLGGYRDLPGGEDYDLVLRAVSMGEHITNIQDILLRYRIRESGETNSRSAIQKMCFKYVQRLFRERMKTGYDSFNAADIKNRMAHIPVTRVQKHNRAQRDLQLSRQAWAGGRKFRACTHLLHSFFISPIQRLYYLDWVKAEMIRQYFLWAKGIA